MACNPLPRLLVTPVLVLALAGIGISPANAAVQNRITAAAANSVPVEVPGSVHPYVRNSTDLGATAGNTRLQGMSIRFTMTDAQQAALDQLLADQQNPSSPRYHQWLTPAEYGAQFGLSSGDIAKVTAWLTSQGFTAIEIANGGAFVRFNGTVAQAQTAFATSIHTLSLNGETHFANVTNVQVPGAFAGVVGAVTGLHNFRMQPHVHTNAVRPDFTSTVSGNHYMAPGDLYTIYNMTPLMATYTVTGETDRSDGAGGHQLGRYRGVPQRFRPEHNQPSRGGARGHGSRSGPELRQLLSQSERPGRVIHRPGMVRGHGSRGHH